MTCTECRGPLPSDASPRRVTCRDYCRQRRHYRLRREAAASEARCEAEERAEAAETMAAAFGRALAPL